MNYSRDAAIPFNKMACQLSRKKCTDDSSVIEKRLTRHFVRFVGSNCFRNRQSTESLPRFCDVLDDPDIQTSLNTPAPVVSLSGTCPHCSVFLFVSAGGDGAHGVGSVRPHLADRRAVLR